MLRFPKELRGAILLYPLEPVRNPLELRWNPSAEAGGLVAAQMWSVAGPGGVSAPMATLV
jgi:hypothetical protein